MNFEMTWLGDDADTALPPKRWIWEGYLAAQRITLFTAIWKSGKTTLLAHLLANRKAGGELIGQAVAPGKSVVVTEEDASFWRERHGRLGFGREDSFICRPFRGLPSMDDWVSLIEHLAALNRTRGTDLAILDPISLFLPVPDSGQVKEVVSALEPLHRLTGAGMAVLLVHHPRRARSQTGTAARGSGALQSFVDIILEMYRANADNLDDRRRRLLGFSRDPATPRSRLIEWSADGTSYACVAETPNDDFLKTWEMLRFALMAADRNLTRAELLEEWPESFPRPKSVTLWRWLDQAFERGLVRRDGAGTRTEPHRYFLPEAMAREP
jgi:AAA domain